MFLLAWLHPTQTDQGVNKNMLGSYSSLPCACVEAPPYKMPSLADVEGGNAWRKGPRTLSKSRKPRSSTSSGLMSYSLATQTAAVLRT